LVVVLDLCILTWCKDNPTILLLEKYDGLRKGDGFCHDGQVCWQITEHGVEDDNDKDDGDLRVKKVAKHADPVVVDPWA